MTSSSSSVSPQRPLAGCQHLSARVARPRQEVWFRETFPEVPFLQLTFEDLLAGTPAQERLAAFLDVPYRPAWRDASAIKIDSNPNDLNTVARSPLQDYPETASLARYFGYDTGDAEIGPSNIGKSNAGDIRFNRIQDVWLSPRQRVWWRRFRKVRATLMRVLDAIRLGDIVRRARRTL